jgi:hypothetical protein
MSSGTSEFLTGMCFANSTTGYIVGSNGTILKMDVTTGIIETQEELIFTIYPNPFSTQTNISFNDDNWHEIKITDVTGNEIKTINYKGKHFIIDIGEIRAGIYFVQTADEKKHVSNKKIIIQ